MLKTFFKLLDKYRCIELKYSFFLGDFFLMKMFTQVLKPSDYKEMEFGAILICSSLF